MNGPRTMSSRFRSKSPVYRGRRGNSVATILYYNNMLTFVVTVRERVAVRTLCSYDCPAVRHSRAPRRCVKPSGGGGRSCAVSRSRPPARLPLRTKDSRTPRVHLPRITTHGRAHTRWNIYSKSRCIHFTTPCTSTLRPIAPTPVPLLPRRSRPRRRRNRRITRACLRDDDDYGVHGCARAHTRQPPPDS